MSEIGEGDLWGVVGLELLGLGRRVKEAGRHEGLAAVFGEFGIVEALDRVWDSYTAVIYQTVVARQRLMRERDETHSRALRGVREVRLWAWRDGGDDALLLRLRENLEDGLPDVLEAHARMEGSGLACWVEYVRDGEK